MTREVVIPLPGNEALATSIARQLNAEHGSLQTRFFPDEETYLRFENQFDGRTVVLVCSLNKPDPKFLPLAFAADAARDLGAEKVILVAPYLCYMRQDRRFHAGEAITSISFARRLSATFDSFVTVDPHLHRYGSLGEIYSIPSRIVHSAAAIAEWIVKNVRQAVLMGPDIESEQWVSEVAREARSPYRVLRKERFGDRNVKIELPDLTEFRAHTPVVIDDIVSSGRTMIETARQMRQQGLVAPVCIAVHGLFTSQTERELLEVAARVVTTNTVPHHTNGIDMSQAITEQVVTLSRL
jgi:ribose-phosphate pyrophosphokinase